MGSALWEIEKAKQEEEAARLKLRQDRLEMRSERSRQRSRQKSERSREKAELQRLINKALSEMRKRIANGTPLPGDGPGFDPMQQIPFIKAREAQHVLMKEEKQHWEQQLQKHQKAIEKETK